jgi:hypothetical protein
MEKVERWLGGRLQDVRAFIDGLYENDLHAKSVDALAGATLGVMTSASLAVAVIGQALARRRSSSSRKRVCQSRRSQGSLRGTTTSMSGMEPPICS